MEEMEYNFAKGLLLTEEEKEEIVIEEEYNNRSPWEDGFERILIGTLLTNKNYRSEYMKNTMTEVWRLEGKVEIKDLARNLFMFIFEKRSDKEAVMSKAPWNFDKSLLMLKIPDKNQNPKETKFDTVEFWIQIHNLPLRALQKNVAIKIGERVGRLIKVDETDEGLRWGAYMRVRVEIDVRKPLQRGAMITLKEIGKIWAEFKYERLPKVCQWCGTLGHSDSSCTEKKEDGKGDYGDLYAEKEIFRSRVYETKKQSSYSSSSSYFRGEEEKSGGNDGKLIAIASKERGKDATVNEENIDFEGSDARSIFEDGNKELVIKKKKAINDNLKKNKESELVDTASSPVKKKINLQKENSQIEISHINRSLIADLGGTSKEETKEKEGKSDANLKKMGRKWKSLARKNNTVGGDKVTLGKRVFDPMNIDEDLEEGQNKKLRVGMEESDNGNAVVNVTGGKNSPRYEK